MYLVLEDSCLNLLKLFQNLTVKLMINTGGNGKKFPKTFDPMVGANSGLFQIKMKERGLAFPDLGCNPLLPYLRVCPIELYWTNFWEDMHRIALLGYCGYAEQTTDHNGVH